MGQKKAVFKKSALERSIREWLGVSQENYASFCGISKSMLSMIELNLRSWPTGKTDLTVIQAFIIARQNPEDLSELEKPHARKKKEWITLLKKLKLDIYKMKMALERQEFDLESAHLLARVCRLLRKQFPETDSIQSSILDLWEHTAQLKIKANSKAEQDWLRLQMDQKSARMDFIRKKLLEWESDPEKN